MKTLAAAVSIGFLIGMQSTGSAAAGDHLRGRVRFGLGRLGTRLDHRATAGRQVDASLQL